MTNNKTSSTEIVAFKDSTTYRESASPIVMIKPESKYHGIIVMPKEPPTPPPHICNTPGFLKRLWLRVRYGITITIGSLFRCECGDTYYWRQNWYNPNPINNYWCLCTADSGNYKWKNAGGEIKSDGA